MRKSFVFVCLSALCMSACRENITINSYDLRYEFGKIKLKKVRSFDETYEFGKTITEGFNSLTSFKANYYQYSFSRSSKEKPIECINANITYNESSFYMKQVQTHALMGGELEKPIVQEYYYINSKLYFKENEGNWSLSTYRPELNEKVKPKLIMHISQSANIRSGKKGKLDLVEQFVLSQNEIIRFISSGEKIKYYYEMIETNSFFNAYEFTYPEKGYSFAVDRPSDFNLA